MTDGLLETRGWDAWIDRRPGGEPPTLHVTGCCVFRTAGYTATLVPTRGGINPDELFLDLAIEEPREAAAEVISEVPVAWSTSASRDYTSVRIVGIATVDVRDVSRAGGTRAAESG